MNNSRKNLIKKVALVGILTALYVVMSLTLKIPIGIGNIQLDMGYVALTVACFTVGPWAAFVGGVGAAIESILFSAYGISYGWIAMNIAIGLILGFIFKISPSLSVRYEDMGMNIFLITIAVIIGVAIKTIIECSLYSIPLAVKLPKSLTAFLIDTAVMVIGLFVVKPVNRLLNKGDKNGQKNWKTSA